MKVLSIEQMTKLKELGVDVSAKEDCLNYKLMYGQSVCKDDMRSFDLHDIIELLPSCIEVDSDYWYLALLKDSDTEYYTCYQNNEFHMYKNFKGENSLDAAYNMLIWVIENGYLKTK